MTLADTLKQLERAVADVPIGELPALLGAMEQLKAVAWTRIQAPTHRAGDEDALLTVPEVAQRLKLCKDHAYELVRRGDIKKVQLGKSVRVRPADLDEYVAKQGD
jgi:excisionase family DNA binding protein